MSNENQFHNPENLTPEQYGAGEGWRLLTLNELQDSPEDAQFWAPSLDGWRKSVENKITSIKYTYRTRAPLPHTESTWIKMSDRKPTEADLPLAMGSWRKDISGVWCQTFCWENLPSPGNWNYWCPMAKLPALPAKEPTRDEQDEKLIDQIQEAFMADKSLLGRKHLIALALTYERSALRHLIKRHECGELPAPEVIREISKRVKLT